VIPEKYVPPGNSREDCAPIPRAEELGCPLLPELPPARIGLTVENSRQEDWGNMNREIMALEMTEYASIALFILIAVVASAICLPKPRPVRAQQRSARPGPHSPGYKIIRNTRLAD
jgi:hypothetical protein